MGELLPGSRAGGGAHSGADHSGSPWRGLGGEDLRAPTIHHYPVTATQEADPADPTS